MRADAVYKRSILRTTIHVVTGIEAAMLDLLGQHLRASTSLAVRRRSAAKRSRNAGLSVLSHRKATPLPYQSRLDEQCDW